MPSPSGTANYENVDEVTPDEDSTYNFENVTGELDLYQLQDHTTEVGAISNVRVTVRCRSPVAGAKVKPLIKTGGVIYEGAEVTLTASYANYYSDWATNPGTGQAWTWAQIDALQAGIKATQVSVLVIARITQLYVEVTYTPGVTHTQTISEILGMVDSVAKRADLKQAVTEQLGMVDSAVAPGTLHLTVAEQLGLLDSVAFPIRVTIMESLGLVDSVAKRADLKQPILDSLGLFDSTVPRRGLKQTVTEQLGLVDSAVPRSLMRRPTNGLNHTTIGGVPKDPDLPDNVEAIYVSVKNTWQDADNLDDEHGYRSYIWIPEETFQVRIMKLHVYAEKFRAYSKAALSKDLGTKTSTGGGAHRHLMYPYYMDGVAPSYWELHQFQTQGEGIGISRHPMPDSPYDRQDHYTYETVAAHTHDVPIGSHDHAIDFGIYEEAIAGRTLSAKLYDPDGNLVKDFGVITTGEDDVILDLSGYFEDLKYGMYYLELAASARLRARCIFYELCLMYAY